MKNSGFILFLVGLALAMSCSITQPGKTTQSPKNDEYDEDISAFRAQPRVIMPEVDTVVYYVEADSAALPVTEKLNTVLDTAAAYNRANIKYIDGFTIQVYGGNNRALAKDYQLDIIRNFPEVESKMVFEQPNYKVRMGQYYTRLEAQEFFTRVRSVFPKAILIPTRIVIEE